MFEILYFSLVVLWFRAKSMCCFSLNFFLFSAVEYNCFCVSHLFLHFTIWTVQTPFTGDRTFTRETETLTSTPSLYCVRIVSTAFELVQLLMCRCIFRSKCFLIVNLSHANCSVTTTATTATHTHTCNDIVRKFSNFRKIRYEYIGIQ